MRITGYASRLREAYINVSNEIGPEESARFTAEEGISHYTDFDKIPEIVFAELPIE